MKSKQASSNEQTEKAERTEGTEGEWSKVSSCIEDNGVLNQFTERGSTP